MNKTKEIVNVIKNACKQVYNDDLELTAEKIVSTKSNLNLHHAKKEKNDEFYTDIHDIENEMNAYTEYNPNVFRDKTILCPCDDPTWSNFTKHFVMNFARYGLKKLICTSYNKGGHGKMFVLDGDTDGNGKIEEADIVASDLVGDGDFRSEEIQRVMDEVDFVITNPPFSLFREFIAWIMKHGKKFAVIGNMNAITYKEVFPLIRDNTIWVGANTKGGTRKGNSLCFIVPKGFSGHTIDVDGTPMVQVSSWWFTNIDFKKRHEFLDLCTMKQLKKNGVEFPKYDNYDAIEVCKTVYIPKDYTGVMGVPISFLDKYNPEQFEIVAFRKGDDGKDLVFTREREREFNRTFVSLYDFDSRDDKERRRKNQWEAYLRENNNKETIEPIDYFFPLSIQSRAAGSMNGLIDGHETYRRILIRKK